MSLGRIYRYCYYRIASKMAQYQSENDVEFRALCLFSLLPAINLLTIFLIISLFGFFSPELSYGSGFSLGLVVLWANYRLLFADRRYGSVLKEFGGAEDPPHGTPLLFAYVVLTLVSFFAAVALNM